MPTPWEQDIALRPRVALCIGATGAAATVTALATLCLTDRICHKHDAAEGAGMTFVCALGGFLGGAATAAVASLLRHGLGWAEWGVLRVRTGIQVARGLSSQAQLDLIVVHARLRRLNWAGLEHALNRMHQVFEHSQGAITARQLAQAAVSLVPDATGDSEAMIGRVWRFVEHLYADSNLPLEVRNALHLQLGFSVVHEPE